MGDHLSTVVQAGIDRPRIHLGDAVGVGRQNEPLPVGIVMMRTAVAAASS